MPNLRSAIISTRPRSKNHRSGSMKSVNPLRAVAVIPAVMFLSFMVLDVGLSERITG